MATAAVLPVRAARDQACLFTLAIQGLDLTGATLSGFVKLEAGTPGAPLVALPKVTAQGQRGVRLQRVEGAGGSTISYLEVFIPAATMAALPAPAEPGADVEFYYQLDIMLPGWLAPSRIFGPLTATYGGGTSVCGAVRLCFGPQTVVVRVDATQGPRGPEGPAGSGGGGEPWAVYLHHYRLDEDTDDVGALRRALIDTTTPGLDNYGKTIVPIYGKGYPAPLDDIDVAAIDPITGEPVEPEFVAQVGDYLVGCWNQNFEGHEDETGNLAFSLWKIWDPTGRARFRRADRSMVHVFHACPTPTPETTIGGTDTQAYVYKRGELLGVVVLGENWRTGYREFYDDMHFNAVEDWKVNVRALGAASDALHWGGGIKGGGVSNMLNRNCLEDDCYFDGYNQNNRNAVSTVSGTGMRYTPQTIRRFTRPGNGNLTPADPWDIYTGIGNPGPRDYEPNTQFTPDPHISDCGGTGLRAEYCGGSAIAFLPGTGNNIPHPVRSFKFRDTTLIEVEKGLIQAFAASSATIDFDVVFDGVSGTGGKRPYEIVFCRGVTIVRARFRRYKLSAVSGYVGGQTNRGFTQDDVEFEECGIESGLTLEVRGLDISYWGKVTFRDCLGTAMALRGGNAFKESSLGRLVFEKNAGAQYEMINSIIVLADDLDNSGAPDSDGMPIIDGATLRVEHVELIGGVAPPALPLLGMPSKLMPVAPANSKLWYSKPTYLTTSPLMERGGPRGYNGAPSAAGQPLDFYPDIPVTGGRVDTPGNPLMRTVITGAITVNTDTGRITAGQGGGSIRATNVIGDHYAGPDGDGIGIEWAEPHSGQAGVAIGAQISGIRSYTALVDTVPATGKLRDLIQGGAFGPEYGVLTYGRLMRAVVAYQTLTVDGQAATTTWFRKFMADTTSSTGWREVGQRVNMGVFPGSQGAAAQLRADLTSFASLQVTKIGTAAELIPALPQ